MFKKKSETSERFLDFGDIRFSMGRIAFDLSELSKIHLPAKLSLAFEDKEFPFFSKKILLKDGVDIIHIHNKVIAAFFELDFELVKYYTKLYFADIEFNRDTIDECYYKFLEGYIIGLKEFNNIVNERLGVFAHDIENIGNAICDVSQEHNMLYDKLIFSSIEPFYDYGFHNAIYYRCWDTFFSTRLNDFRENLKRERFLSDSRIELGVDFEKAKKDLQELLYFQHRNKNYKIFTKDEFECFLRGNFIGFGEKLDFEPIKLPPNLKLAIIRFFANFYIMHNKCKQRGRYINMLKNSFVDYKNDKHLNSNFKNY